MSLPQNSTWQVTLRSWIGTLVSTDFDTGTPGLGYDAAYFTGDDDLLYKTWITFNNLGRGISPTIEGVRVASSVFLLSTIENGGDVYMNVDNIIEPMQIAWLYDWDYPGNPYHNQIEVANRALVGAICDMIMTSENYGNSQTSASAISAQAYVYSIVGHLLPATEQAAYEEGLEAVFELLDASGPTGIQADLELQGVTGMYLIGQILGGEFITRARTFAENFMSSHYKEAGYIDHGNGMDPSYNGFSILYMLWTAHMTDYEFIPEHLHQMSKLKAHLTFKEQPETPYAQDGIFIGPSHFSTNTSLGSPVDQASSTSRDNAVGFFSSHARYLRYTGREWATWFEPVGVTDVATMLTDIEGWTDRANIVGTSLGTYNMWVWPSTNTPGVWSSTAHQFIPNMAWEAYPGTGYYNKVLEQGYYDIPFEKEEDFIEQFGEDFVIWKLNGSGGVIHLGRLAWWTPNGEALSGHSGGAISCYWTEKTRLAAFGFQSGYAGSTPDTWANVNTWASHHIWGRAGGDPFASGRNRIVEKTIDINPEGTSTVLLEGAIGDHDSGRSVDNNSVTGTINYSREFKIKQDGLLITSSLTSDETDTIDELWDAFPFYLSDYKITRDANNDAIIETYSNGVWSPLVRGQEIQVDKVSLHKETGYVVLSFTETQTVYFEPLVSDTDYQIHSRVQMMHTKLAGAGTMPASVSVSYELSEGLEFRDEVVPHHSWPTTATAWWSGESLTDSINLKTLVPVGSPTLGAGKKGNAFYTTSAGDYYKIANADANRYAPRFSDMTIAFWYYNDAGNTDGNGFISFGGNPASGQPGYSISPQSDNLEIVFQDATTQHKFNTNAASLVDDTWQSCVVTINRAGNIEVYIDTVLVGTNDISDIELSDIVPTQDFLLGANFDLDASDSRLNEIIIDRRAWDISEVMRYHQGGNSATYAEVTDDTPSHLYVEQFSTDGSNAGFKDITIKGVRAGDDIVLVCAVDNVHTMDAPIYESDDSDAGFTLLDADNQGNTLTAWYKHATVLDEGEVTYTIALDSGLEKFAVGYIVTRGEGLDGTATITTNTLTNSPTSPSITTTGTKSRVYHILSVSGAGTTVDTPPTDTDFVFDVGDQGSGGIRMYCYSDIQETAGATGVRNWAISAGQNSVGLTFAVKQTELVSDYRTSAARKVYLEILPEHVGGSGTQKGYPTLITEHALRKVNPDMLTLGHADEFDIGSARFSYDVFGRDPIPGFVIDTDLNADYKESKFEGFTRLPQVNTTNSIGNGVYLWWIPGSVKSQPAIDGRRGENDTINGDIVFAGFRNDYTDSSIYNNDATNSGVTDKAAVPYGSVPAWEFAGTDYLEIADDDSISNPSGITMMLWVFPDSGTTVEQGLVGKRTDVDNIEYDLTVNTDANLSLKYYDGSAIQSLDVDFGDNMLTGIWQQVTAEIYEDAGDVKLRLMSNNIEIGSATIASSTIETNTASIKIGNIEQPSGIFASPYDGGMKGLLILKSILPDAIKTTLHNSQHTEFNFWRGERHYAEGTDETGQRFSALSAPSIVETVEENAYTYNSNITYFDNYTIASQPSDWTEQWNVGDGSATVVVDTKAIGNTVLQIAAGSTNHYGLSWKEQVHEDVEVLARVKTSSTTGNQSRVIVRGSGASGAENAYIAELRGGTTLALSKLVAGTATDIDIDDAFTWTADTFYWIRLQAIGEDLKAKVWNINSPEPEAWNAEGTDSDIDTGWIGIGREESATQDCDVFSYGLRGEPAVLSYAEEVVLDKPVGYWSFNQIVAGSIPDITKANDITRELATFGNDSLVWNDPKGHSVELQGENSYLWAGNAFTGTGIGRTVELIFENQGGTQHPLIELATDSVADQAFAIYAYIPTGLGGSSSFDTTSGLVIDFEDRQLAFPYEGFSEGRHHVVIGWDGATAFRVMINGTLPDYYRYESSTWSSVLTQPAALSATPVPTWKELWVGRSTNPLWGATETYSPIRVGAVALYNSYLSQDRMYAKYIAAGAGDSNYYTDMREYESETKPSDWTNRWGAGDETLVARNVNGATFAKSLSVRSLTTDKYAWSWDKLNSVYSFDTIFKIRQDTYSGSQGSFWFRAGGSAGSENGYYIEWDGTTGLSLWRSDAGTATEISNQTSITRSDNEWYWVRVRLVGDTVTVKTWEEFGPEPTAWLIDESGLDTYNTGWTGFSTEAIVQLDIDQIAITVETSKDVSKQLLAWTDFSEYGTGSVPSDWEPRWNQTAEWDVETDGTATGGQALVHVPTSDQMIAITWNHKEDKDVEVLIKTKITNITSDSYNPGITARSSGGAGSETHYASDLLRFSSADNLRLFEHISGTFTQFTSPSITLVAGNYYWLRFRLEGNTLSAKYWEDGSSEPTSWTSETTDDTLTGIGSVGLHHFLDNAKYHYDVVSVATGGRTAMAGSPPSLAQSAGFGEDAFGDSSFGSTGFSAIATGLSVEFNASGIVAGDYSISRYEWDLGDGNNLVGVAPGSHVYTDPGDYLITLYVTDVKGQQSVYSKWVKLEGSIRTNFAEYVTGTDAPGWIKRYVNETYTISDSVGDLGAKSIQVTPATAGLKELSFKDLQAEDLTVMSKFTHAANARGGINIRSKSGASGNETFYLCEYESNVTSSLRIIKVVDGVETTLDTDTSVTIANGSKYCMIFQAIGDALKAKVWLATDAEPGAWTTEITDASISGPGTLGINVRDAGVQVDLDFFSAGFNGTDAPDPDVSVRIDTDLTGAEGATVQIPILIDDTTGLNITEWEATVTYDSSLIDITGVTNTGTLSSALTVTPDVSNADRIIISAATGTALTGDGTLILLDATLLDAGDAALNLIDVELNDNVTAPDALTSDGVISISGPAHPTAAFTSSPDNGTVSLVVNFDASDSSFGGGTEISSYSWDFGDGSSAGSGVAPEHTYTTAGIYTVTLTITNDLSDAAVATDEVSVRSVPVAVMNGSFSGGGDGVGILDDVSLWMELEDNTDSMGGVDFTENNSPVYGAAKVGNGYIGDGVDGTKSLQRSATSGGDITIGTNDWAINLWVKWTNVGHVSRSLISLSNTDFQIQQLFSGTERLSFFYNTEAGNGSTQVVGLTVGQWYNMHAQYTHATREVKVRLNDDDGLQNSKTLTADLRDRSANLFIGGHNSGTNYHGDIDNVIIRKGSLWTDAQVTLLYNGGAGLSHAAAAAMNVPANTLDWDFNAYGSEGGNSSIASYEWDFNDGSPLAYGPSVSHTYTAGTYNPTLTVYNLDGDSTTSTMEVVASSGDTDPVASFTSTPDNGPNPLTVAFDAAASTAGGGETITGYSWDFGDGSSAGTGVDPSHTYTVSGTYTVTLTVTNSATNTNQTTDSITVRVPPTAAFTSTPDNGGSPLSVDFDASSTTDGDGSSISSYSWDFGDGSSAGSGVNPTHVYNTTGSFTVTLTVTNDLGDTDTETDTITVRVSPTASFTATPESGPRPLLVNLDASASIAGDGSSITSYSWNFGDGSPAGSGVTTDHTYTSENQYNITLTVTNNLGDTDTETILVEARTAPTAAFTSTPDNGPNPLTVNFDASGTTTGSGASITSYSWDFDDGSSAGSGVTPSHDFVNAGTYTVTLTVTNDEGDTDQVTDSITVRTAPVASFTTTPDNGVSPLSINVDATASTAGTGSITTYSWDWGDAEPDDTGSTQTHTYTSAGTYTITLTITNDSGDTDTETDTVTVRTAPTAAFTSTPDNGQMPLTVAFDASTTNVGSGSSITSYSWSWGDGTPDGTGQTPNHTYTTADSFTVTLTVTNDNGDTDTETDTIVSRSGPTASFTSTPDNGAAPLDVTFDAAASTEGDGSSITGYVWDFGDASSAGSGVNPTHQYTSDGTYTATLTVTNDNGDTAQTTDTIVVGVEGPNATFVRTPVEGAAPLTVDVDATSSDAGGGSSITTYSWNWGDGSSDSTGSIQGHDYTTPGTYNITLTVTNDNTDTDQDVQSVTVRTAPTASFTSTPDNGTAPLTVNVDATASTDGDGSSITGYVWEWGDGSANGSGVTDSHTYNTPGTYNITLTVTNDLGDEGTLDDVITVNGTDIVATISDSETDIVGNTLSIPISVTDTTGENITAYSFDVVFDDSIISIDDVETTGSLSTSATPLTNEGTPGTYSITWASATPITGAGALLFLTVTVLDAGVTALDIQNLVWNEGTPTADSNDGTFTGVAPSGPTASFTANPTSGFFPLTVEFNAGGSVAGDNAIASYSWDFGDGSAAGSGVNPSHTYTTAGTFSVVLTVTDTAAAEDTATSDVTANTPPADPTAAFTSTPDSGTAPLTVEFDASTTDVGGGSSITGYVWDFGDGSSAGSGVNPSHEYTATGTFTVTLTVTNDNDDTDQTTDTITVSAPNVAPNASFTQDVTSGEAPLIVTFDASGSSDSDGTIVGYSWNFGDGSSLGAGVNPSHTYSSAGTYTAVLTVTDNDGGVDQSSVLITVAATNPPPTAVATSDVTSGPSPLTVTFDGSGSSDTGGGTIATYEWNFGDGSTATGVNPVHTFESGGQFTVRLTVTDDGGKTSSVFLEILVASSGNDSQVDIRLLAGKKVRVYNKPPSAAGASPDRLIGKSSLQNARRQTKSDLNTVKKILDSINKNNLFS